jgi:two-component system, OmpR family, KDP operon response regulator KdpE
VSDAATAPNVLVVDDELQIRRFLRSGFELDGYSVSEAENGREAIRAATLRPTDLIILDLALPDLDGSQVLERIRSWSSVPIIILSVKSSEMEKVRLFELGADDYVTKPFGMAELLARSKVVLRRKARATTGDSVIRIDHLKIDLAARNVFVADERLTLTPKEYRLLQILAQYPGNVVTHQELLKEIWGLPHINDTHYLRIVVRKLRQKIESEPNHPRILLTELGVGYRLAPPNDPAEAQAG